MFSCRFCGSPLTHSFADLGNTPLANSYLSEEMLSKPEPSYPLHARACSNCFLVQVESVVPPEHIFSDYAYFSSYSSSWVDHARRFTEMAISRFDLGSESKVIELASNDGYLLKHFVEHHIPCLGIEPAANVAEVAVKAGVPTEVRFFGLNTAHDLAARGWSADLIVANNVLAHVPDLNDFVAGIAALLRPSGVVSIEFPHLLKLINEAQFDTIYHEHFCYFSLLTIEKIFAAHGLAVFDVSELPTHGGSLRIFARRKDGVERQEGEGVAKVRQDESDAGLGTMAAYENFSKKVNSICEQLTVFITREHLAGKTIVAYGAAAKGNTLLNVCGIKADAIPYVVDKNPAKQGMYLPGSHIPISTPERIFETKPDYVLILPWNLSGEIRHEMQGINHWGGKFITAIPSVKVAA